MPINSISTKLKEFYNLMIPFNLLHEKNLAFKLSSPTCCKQKGGKKNISPCKWPLICKANKPNGL